VACKLTGTLSFVRCLSQSKLEQRLYRKKLKPQFPWLFVVALSPIIAAKLRTPRVGEVTFVDVQSSYVIKRRTNIPFRNCIYVSIYLSILTCTKSTGMLSSKSFLVSTYPKNLET